jgi:glycosyltransferase involved in cell wall biosynthesis
VRIVQIIDSLAIADGGPPRFAFELDAALNGKHGVRSQLVSINGHPQDSVVAATGASANTRQHPLWLNGTEDRLSLLRLIRLLRSADAVIIHGYFYLWLPVLALATRVIGVNVYLTPHGSLTPYQRTFSVRRKRLYEAVAGKLLRGAVTKFVLQSSIEEKQIQDLFPGAATFVGGVGTVLPEEPGVGDEIHNPLRLLSMSRIAPKKNVEVMLHAVRHLLDEGTSVHLTIAGRGRPDYEEDLKRLSQKLRLNETVTFAGSVAGADKQHLYEQSDIFLLPSDDENFGIGVAEALAHGVPVVATSAVAAATNITGHSGRVITRPDAKLLAEAVNDLAAVKPFRDARQEAVRVASVSFDWSSVAGRWLDGMRSNLSHCAR